MQQIERRAEQVRQFNRFYTRHIGVLGEGHLGSPFSLTEVRVLYELAHRDSPTASEIAAALGLDRGYLSRTLRSFKKRGLIETRPGRSDARRSLLRLTGRGRKAFASLDSRARDEIVHLLEPLDAQEQRRLLGAMQTIRSTLREERTSEAATGATPSLRLRGPRPGDLGWIVHRHGVIYAAEYGYDERFEALVAKIVAGFVESWNPDRERCWIAERDGEMVGSIFVVAKSDTVAQLRLLLVEPSARGLGIGRRLVDEVINFSRQVGYEKIQLWTQSELTAARKIYEAAGFVHVGDAPHESFGKPLVAETWELTV